jgi:hypothetical protein
MDRLLSFHEEETMVFRSFGKQLYIRMISFPANILKLNKDNNNSIIKMEERGYE